MRTRDLRETDFESLYETQKDPESRWMAGFGFNDFTEKDAFFRHLSRIAENEESIYKVIEHEGQIVGNVGKWNNVQGPELMYEIDKKFRGKGLATSAVKEFLIVFEERPLYAHTTSDNLTSQAVLRKFGFTKYEEIVTFSEIRNSEVLELGFVLN